MTIPYVRTDDIVGYTLRADNYCLACILGQVAPPTYPNPQPLAYVELALDYFAALAGVDRTDESTFDTDEFPKIVLRGQVGAGDPERGEYAETCGGCHVVLAVAS